MEKIRLFFKGIQIFSIVLGLSILTDMFILGGKIKLFIKAYANTTDYSPFSTDGQSNYVLLFVIFIVIVAVYILFKLLGHLDEIVDEKEKEK